MVDEKIERVIFGFGALFDIQRVKSSKMKIGQAKPLADLWTLFARLRSGYTAELSIGTALPVYWVIELLEALNLMHFFKEGSLVGRSKTKSNESYSDIWKRAALKTPYGNCLVVDDSLLGVKAAKEVGMPCLLFIPKNRGKAYSIPEHAGLDIISRLEEVFYYLR